MTPEGEPERPPTEAPPEPKALTPPPEQDWQTRFKYLLADFENFRRRVDRERELARQHGQLWVLRNLLPIFEAFERAAAAADRLPARDPLRLGLDVMAKEWERFLAAQQLEPVAKVGEPFRSEEHEAVAEVGPGSGIPEGAVAEVVQQGYRAPAGLVRPAKVAVARRPAMEAPPTAEAPDRATPP